VYSNKASKDVEFYSKYKQIKASLRCPFFWWATNKQNPITQLTNYQQVKGIEKKHCNPLISKDLGGAAGRGPLTRW